MLRVGITGGIGSGKSTVCRLFEALGIPVSYADDDAKWLMQHDAALVGSIRALLGQKAYDAAGRPDRAFIASQVFEDSGRLAALNALVHPATVAHSIAWFARQTAPYAVKEAALFFESGTENGVDFMIGVAAPEVLRIARVMQRNGISEGDVRARMARQMDDAGKMQRCDVVLVNDDTTAVLPQVLAAHNRLLAMSA